MARDSPARDQELLPSPLVKSLWGLAARRRPTRTGTHARKAHVHVQVQRDPPRVGGWDKQNTNTARPARLDDATPGAAAAVSVSPDKSVGTSQITDAHRAPPRSF